MKTEAGLKKMLESANRIAAQHLVFIKTNGESGRSATADLAIFEEMEKTESNKYSALKTEYFILLALTQAMQKELRRMEKKENGFR